LIDQNFKEFKLDNNLEELLPQDLEMIFQYLMDPLRRPLPVRLQTLTELELLGLELMLQNLMQELREAKQLKQIH
jgi:hypothetical protein